MDQARRTILVVEHDPAVAQQLRRHLESLGHDVLAAAHSAERALRIVDMCRPDIVLMDLHLPGELSPAESAALLRARVDAPIVVITTEADAELLHRVRQIDPFAQLPRNVGPEDLRNVLESAWHKHQADKRLQAPLTPMSIDRALRDPRVTNPESQPPPNKASVGWLAASVAHEINNPLAAALMSLEVAQHELDNLNGHKPAEATLRDLQQGMREATEACQRIRDIVANLRSLSHATPTKELTASQPAPTSRRASVLLIDDDVIVANTIERALRDNHDVTLLTSGNAALNAIAEGKRFDVVLCDLMMPTMTGMDLHAALLKSHPRLAASMVFMTGGAFTPRAQAFLEAIPNQRLEKPFRRETLLRVIHDVLKISQQSAA